MIPNIIRIKENEFYILYKRILAKKEIMPLYVIYYSEKFDGGLCKEFSKKQEAIRFFDKATKEAIEYASELKEIL